MCTHAPEGVDRRPRVHTAVAGGQCRPTIGGAVFVVRRFADAEVFVVLVLVVRRLLLHGPVAADDVVPAAAWKIDLEKKKKPYE